MSYRNDHDAALARIDALEAELEQLARKELDRAEPARPVKKSWLLPTTLALTAVGIVSVITLATTNGHASEKPTLAEARAPIAALPTPSMPSERAKLLECVDQFDARVAKGEPSSLACLDTLSKEVGDVGLGTDIHATLVAWRTAEWARKWNDRAALGEAIHAYIIPSFTR